MKEGYTVLKIHDKSNGRKQIYSTKVKVWDFKYEGKCQKNPRI